MPGQQPAPQMNAFGGQTDPRMMQMGQMMQAQGQGQQEQLLATLAKMGPPPQMPQQAQPINPAGNTMATQGFQQMLQQAMGRMPPQMMTGAAPPPQTRGEAATSPGALMMGGRF